MLNRRRFIKTTAAAMAATALIPKNLLAHNNDKTIGIQLYTLRDMIAEDLEGTLEIIASIGYTTTEAAGYSDRKFYGFYPKEYKRLLDGFGLKHVSSHAKFSLADASAVINDTAESGAKYLVFPWLGEEERKTIDQYKKLADEFNLIGELASKSGITFAYHNHAFEFEEINGVIPYNVLLENTNPDYVSMELDLYWIMYGGFNPQEYFDVFPGRFKLFHVKDMADTSEMAMAPVGKGIINFKSIFKQQKLAGLEYSFVEQDVHKNEQPVQNITESFRYLNHLSDY